MTAGRAWAVLVGAILWWERRCHRSGRPEHLLSRGMDRARQRHRVMRVGLNVAVIATALHLLRWVPERLDIYQAMSWTRRSSGASDLGEMPRQFN